MEAVIAEVGKTARYVVSSNDRAARFAALSALYAALYWLLVLYPS
jgi:hypothetical protein